MISPARLAALPEIRTIKELGVKPEAGAYPVVPTSGIMVRPAGIDKASTEKLVTGVVKAEADPKFVEAMKKGRIECFVPLGIAICRMAFSGRMSVRLPQKGQMGIEFDLKL